MTSGSSDRITRIEDDLENAKRIILTVARSSEAAEKRMAATDKRIDQLTVNVDQLTEKVDQLTINVDQLTAKVDQTTVNVNNLTSAITQNAVDADADRSMVMSILDRMDELYLSNTRIWQYLMTKDGNGTQG